MKTTGLILVLLLVAAPVFAGGGQDLVVTPADLSRSDFRFAVNEDGGLTISIGGEDFVVRSHFSRPGGGMLALGTTAGLGQANAWPCESRRESETVFCRVTATNSAYRLERRIEVRPNHIQIKDTFTNLTPALIGIQSGNEIYAPGCSLALLNGIQRSGDCRFQAPEIPIVQVMGKKVSLGMVARDDVYRNHSTCYGANQSWGISDEYLGLPPRGACTAVWELYPVEGADHFRFINTVRSVWGTAAARIPGLLAFVYPQRIWSGNRQRLDQMSVAEMKRWLETTRIHTLGFCIDAEKGAPGAEKGRNKGMFAPWPWTCIEAFGEDYLRAKTSKDYWRAILARLREAKPDLKIVPYFHMCSNPDNPELGVSRVLLAGGKQKSFKNFLGIERPYYYPTPGNSFGRVIREVFRTEMSEFGQDGLYIDEYSYGNRIINMQGVPDWDGSTVLIDPKTNEVIQKGTNLALITRAMRTEFNQAILSAGKELWTNWQPTTEADTALNVPHFLEYVREEEWPRGDLASPLGCGGAAAKSNAEVMHDLHRFLEYGLLYVHIGNGAYAEATPSIFGDIYPITPTELHAGYIIGKERIVTTRSGRFGFNDAAPLETVVYDRSGLPKADGTRFVSEGGKTSCMLNLQDGEIAIVKRQGAKE